MTVPCSASTDTSAGHAIAARTHGPMFLVVGPAAGGAGHVPIPRQTYGIPTVRFLREDDPIVECLPLSDGIPSCIIRSAPPAWRNVPDVKTVRLDAPIEDATDPFHPEEEDTPEPHSPTERTPPCTT